MQFELHFLKLRDEFFCNDAEGFKFIFVSDLEATQLKGGRKFSADHFGELLESTINIGFCFSSFGYKKKRRHIAFRQRRHKFGRSVLEEALDFLRPHLLSTQPGKKCLLDVCLAKF